MLYTLEARAYIVWECILQKKGGNYAGKGSSLAGDSKSGFQNMDLSGEISDKELKRMIAEEVRQFGKVHLLSLQARETCEEQIFNSFRKLDILQELLDDPEVTEIMVNGAAHIFYEKHGVLYPWEKGNFRKNGCGI